MRGVIAAILALAVVVAAVEDTLAPKEKKDYGHVIGIDLGTTFSCVSVTRNGVTEIIPNDLGSRITASYVAWANGTKLVGEAAKNQAAKNPMNTFYDIKRFIGRRYNDPTVQHDIQHYPYKVVNEDGVPMVIANRRGKDERLAPEEVSAQVLIKMKETAEAYLETKVTHAVITVPAYFNDAQRSATKLAGRIAGLEVLRIINEPTAAAIAYGLDKDKNSAKKIIVFDLGGGTFDVSVLTISNGVFEVISTNGDTHLGGEDFDQRTVSHFVKIIQKKYNKDITKDPRAMHLLKRAVENAKISLSEAFSTKLEIDNLAEGIPTFSESLTRARFEDLNMDLFKKTLGPTKKALADAKLDVADVDEVVLVGGSTRIPKVREILKELFQGKTLHTEVNPDEAIAYGAGVQGCVLSQSCKAPDVLLLDITPLTLGMEDEDGVMVKIVERNSVIPTEKSAPFTTVEDNQQSVLFRVYEGERSIAKHNHRLGEFSLKVPPAPKGMPEISVTFKIDANGILHVSARDTASGQTESIKITQDRGIRSEDDVKRMVADAAAAEDEDKKFMERVEARQALDAYASSIRASLATFKDRLKKAEREEVTEAAEKVIKWLKHNRDREAEVYAKKKRALEDVVAPVLSRLYKNKEGGGNKGGVSDDEGDKKTAMFSDAEEPAAPLGKESSKAGEFDAKLDEV